MFQHTAARRRLTAAFRCRAAGRSFNTQPPEGGWVSGVQFVPLSQVSTHSRPKAAGGMYRPMMAAMGVSTHSRPKAAVLTPPNTRWSACVSTHSRPKAAALGNHLEAQSRTVSTHSRPKAAAFLASAGVSGSLFQHTAARRRLAFAAHQPRRLSVSTHSRPKAAGPIPAQLRQLGCFNTQPPEGGWALPPTP